MPFPSNAPKPHLPRLELPWIARDISGGGVDVQPARSLIFRAIRPHRPGLVDDRCTSHCNSSPTSSNNCKWTETSEQGRQNNTGKNQYRRLRNLSSLYAAALFICSTCVHSNQRIDFRYLLLVFFWTLAKHFSRSSWWSRRLRECQRMISSSACNK